MLLLPIPNKVRSPKLNPKQRKVLSLNGKVSYLCVTYMFSFLFPLLCKELLQFWTIT